MEVKNDNNGRVSSVGKYGRIVLQFKTFRFGAVQSTVVFLWLQWEIELHLGRTSLAEALLPQVIEACQFCKLHLKAVLAKAT